MNDSTFLYRLFSLSARLRILLVSLILLAISIQSLAQDSPSKKPESVRRPNILWLIGENIGLDLGCYGAKNVHTPNLDRLAAEGVRFSNTFCTAPVCASSRSAFFVGMYQTSTDTQNMRSHRDDAFRLPEGVRPITHRLQEIGYHTANIRTIDDKPVGTGKLDLNFVNEGAIYQSENWTALKSKQPFFAVVNSHEVEYDIYDRKSHEKERVEWVGEREHVAYATPENVTPPPYYPDHPLVREEWARFLNSISGMDLRIGWVLDKLRADGLEDDTIIVFFADNGRLDANGIHWCTDSGLRVPLIVRWPKNFPAPKSCAPGSLDERLVSLIDVTATTLDFARVPKPMLIQGRVLFGELTEPPRSYVFAARDRIDETYQRIRSVHDSRYHYIRTISTGPTFASLNRYKEKCFPVMPLMRRLYAEGKLDAAARSLMERVGPCEELYDLQSDSHEIANLADSTRPEHHDALLRLRTALDTWMIETGDRGWIREPESIIAPFTPEMDAWFGTPDWAK